ncbi:MAG: SpoIIE family protein phosphatase [Acidobacteriaceae bacterium]
MTPKAELQTMFLVDGSEKRMLKLEPLPFTVGRLAENALVLTQPFVSRNHASITLEGGAFILADTGSRHGTYVNGKKVDRQVLSPHDRIQFGSLQAPVLVFGEEAPEQVTTQHDLLGKLQALTESTSELRKLRWLLDAARDLNDAGAVESVLASLIEATLTLTKAERGYVLLTGADGQLTLAAGRDSSGNRLEDADSLSQTAIRRATESGSEFILTDTLSSGETPLSHSMVAQNLRSVICFPLLRRRDPTRVAVGTHGSSILGVLYLDSRFVPGNLTGIDHDMLRTIAREAAALVENTALVAAEEQARQYREEMEIAAKIQKGLMAVQHPKLSFAGIEAMSVPCKEIGGDFFNVVADGSSLSVALVDVSGKGISAALLASTLQGMLYMQLSSGQPLEEIAAVLNSYLCTKDVGKYATMVLMRLHEDGSLEFVNCGHVQPRIDSCGEVEHLESCNLPVGLLPDASYVSSRGQLRPGCRVLLVSDGITEAENSSGDMFGDERLDTGLAANKLNELAASLWEFCGSEPLRDDCTMVELTYRG